MKCVLLSWVMNVIYSVVQFRFRMNEIFKSKISLELELNWTKKNEKFFSPTSKVVCKWVCLFGKQTYLFETVALVPTK